MQHLTNLLQDTFTFLAQAHANPLKLVGQHRLSPSALTQLNTLFCVPEFIRPKHAHTRQGQWQKNVHPQKSELYTTRLRFIHYLCQSAGLVEISQRQLVPALWVAPYLTQNIFQQAQFLFHAAFPSKPTRAQREQWRLFKMPDHPLGASQSFAQWLILILRNVPPEQNIKLTTLLKLYRDAARAKQFIPFESDDPADAPANLIRAHLELLQEFDAINLRANSLEITPLGVALLHDTPLALDSIPHRAEPLRWNHSKKQNTLPDLIATAHADTNHLWQLTAYAEHTATLASARINCRLYRLDAEKIRRALDQNISDTDIHAFLETITANALPMPVSNWLHQIADTYAQITLRRVTLLETDQPAQLTALTRSKTIRACIQRTLSPRAVVVKPQRVTQLARRLQHRNLHPRLEHLNSNQSPVTSNQSPITQSPNALITQSLHPSISPSLPLSLFDESTLAHFYLAARIAQRVQALNPSAYQIPFAVAAELAEKISAHDREIADALARELFENLTVQQKSHPTAPRIERDLPSLDFTTALEKIHQALRKNAQLEITYYSPYRDETTTRVIEPLRVEEHDNYHYVIAYCHLDHAERTFRVDRILEIHGEPSRTIADSESRIASRASRISNR